MSRTYRRKKGRLAFWLTSDNFELRNDWPECDVKEELRIFYSDRYSSKNEKPYLKISRRKIRAAERVACAKVLTCDNYECYDFKTSNADKQWKGIMWEIY